MSETMYFVEGEATKANRAGDVDLAVAFQFARDEVLKLTRSGAKALKNATATVRVPTSFVSC